MVRNLYRYEINSPEEQTKIETDLAKYECEVSKIIKERFLNDEDIYLTLEEDEKLKLFFAIMEFRNENTNHLFGDQMTEESKAFYSKYQKDGNFNDFWKRNLGELANCRSLSDVLRNPDIDEPIKIFMTRDTFNLFGKYFVVAENRGSKDFIIGDAYPTVIKGVVNENFSLNMYEIYPLSPNRVLLFASNGVESAPKIASGFRSDVFRRPRINNETGKIRIHVKKIYENEVGFINGEVLKTSKIGFAFKNKDRVDVK